MTDQPKFAVGDTVIYAKNTMQRRRGNRAVVKDRHFDGTRWHYDVSYLDGSLPASKYLSESSLEADPDTRTVFITMPGGAEHLTHELASDHAREWRNMTILKASQQRTGHGWTITACSGPIDPLPPRTTRYFAFDTEDAKMITHGHGVEKLPRSDRDYFKVEFEGIRPVSVELVKGLRP